MCATILICSMHPILFYFLYFDNTSTVIWWWWTTYRIQERWYIQKKLYCFENYEQITCSRPILLWLLLRCAGWVDLLSFLLSPDTTILCTRTCIYIYTHTYTHTHTHTHTHHITIIPFKHCVGWNINMLVCVISYLWYYADLVSYIYACVADGVDEGKALGNLSLLCTLQPKLNISSVI